MIFLLTQTGKVRTIETNLKNITADKVDLGFEVDPMFQMMSAAFDEGGASGLLLNRLRCYDSSQSLILDSSTTVNVVEDVEAEVPQESKKPVDVATLKGYSFTILTCKRYTTHFSHLNFYVNCKCLHCGLIRCLVLLIAFLIILN